MGSPAVARVPPNERLSFLNIPTVIPVADPDEDPRVVSMRRACEEARLRQEAAYEHGKWGAENGGYIPRIASTSLDPEGRIPPLRGAGYQAERQGDAPVSRSRRQ